VIQERLARASITTRTSRYDHPFDGHDQSVIEGLDAAHDEAVAPVTNVTQMDHAQPASGGVI
jgi:hypothetical protein